MRAAPWIAAAVLAAAGCRRGDDAHSSPAGDGPAAARDPYAAARARLVDTVRAGGVTDDRVLAAIGAVPRHELVPEHVRGDAYADVPLPIGDGQTISQPSIVAIMSAAARIEPGDRVLEVGTGSGYQAAVLAELGADVYSVEIVPPLARRAADDLRRLGYDRVHLRIGDGWQGWPEAAPFDAIVVTAAPPQVPPRLIEQLAEGGRLVIPVGGRDQLQELRVITRTADGATSEALLPVRFVPMTGGDAGQSADR